jgi:hypothetical protein
MSRRAGTDGKAGKAGVAGSKEASVSDKKKSKDRSNEADDRAARLISRTLSSAKCYCLSEAAAVQSSKEKQPQGETETELSPTNRSRGQVRGGSRGRINASESDEEDELALSGAAAISEEQGQDKLNKTTRILVQIFKIHYSNIIIVKQPRRINHSYSNLKFARFVGNNIVAVPAPAHAPEFEGSNCIHGVFDSNMIVRSTLLI